MSYLVIVCLDGHNSRLGLTHFVQYFFPTIFIFIWFVELCPKFRIWTQFYPPPLPLPPPPLKQAPVLFFNIQFFVISVKVSVKLQAQETWGSKKPSYNVCMYRQTILSGISMVSAPNHMYLTIQISDKKLSGIWYSDPLCICLCFIVYLFTLISSERVCLLFAYHYH